MEAVLKFLTHFHTQSGEFRTPIADETPYERMVREFEAGVPNLVETMKLVLPDGSTEAQQLKQWKTWAKEERAALRGKIRVRHSLVPAKRSSQVKLRTLSSDVSEEFVALYLCIQSAQLFVPEEKPDGGVLFYSPSEMAGELDYVRDWFEDDDEDFESSESDGELELVGSPAWLNDCIVFAGIGQAADRFLLAGAGPYAGSVFAFDHDGLSMRRVATSFAEFLEFLIAEPLVVARWVGIYGADAYHEAA